MLRRRLLFDPARIGPRGGHTWLERPGPGMLALGQPASTGVSMAGIDYAASEVWGGKTSRGQHRRS